jgi:DnaJ-class molecular chaperone
LISFIEFEVGCFDSQRKEVTMLKVHILNTCSHCNGEAYQPVSEAEDCQGHKYTRYVPCPICEGSGNEPKWISLEDFAKLIQQALCPHEHTSYQGNMHFTAGKLSHKGSAAGT